MEECKPLLSGQIRAHFDFLAKSAAFDNGQQAGAYTRPLSQLERFLRDRGCG